MSEIKSVYPDEISPNEDSQESQENTPIDLPEILDLTEEEENRLKELLAKTGGVARVESLGQLLILCRLLSLKVQF